MYGTRRLSQSRWAAEIARTPDPTDQFVGSPSFIIAADGTWWASHNWFGSGTNNDTTLIYKSEDDGATWTLVDTITGVWWATLFEHAANMYLLGTTTEYGNLVLYYSDDDWATNSNVTISSGNYHKGSTAFAALDGYLFFAVEDAQSGSPTWPTSFLAQVWFADTADLTNASNWRSSNTISYNTSWGDGGWSQEGWLEGQRRQRRRRY
jgi:hypothetical protein